MADPELLPTVVLEHARTGQPIVVDKDDYLARKDTRYANWRLLGHGDFIAPPPLPSQSPDPDLSAGDAPLPKSAGPEPACSKQANAKPACSKLANSRPARSKRGRRRRSRG